MKFNEIVKKTSLAILTAGLLVGLADVKDFAPVTVDAFHIGQILFFHVYLPPSSMVKGIAEAMPATRLMGRA